MHTDAIDCNQMPTASNTTMNTTQYHNIITNAGFSKIETGGGCTAFSKDDILITAQDDPSCPTADDIALVSKDGEIIGEYTAEELVGKIGQLAKA
jgi:hypothetical protein